MHIHVSDHIKATGGLVTGIMLSVPSWLELFTSYLQVVSLVGSIGVSILTGVMILKKLRKNDSKTKHS